MIRSPQTVAIELARKLDVEAAQCSDDSVAYARLCEIANLVGGEPGSIRSNLEYTMASAEERVFEDEYPDRSPWVYRRAMAERDDFALRFCAGAKEILEQAAIEMRVAA